MPEGQQGVALYLFIYIYIYWKNTNDTRENYDDSDIWMEGEAGQLVTLFATLDNIETVNIILWTY